jgi:hypothetical protein
VGCKLYWVNRSRKKAGFFELVKSCFFLKQASKLQAFCIFHRTDVFGLFLRVDFGSILYVCHAAKMGFSGSGRTIFNHFNLYCWCANLFFSFHLLTYKSCKTQVFLLQLHWRCFYLGICICVLQLKLRLSSTTMCTLQNTILSTWDRGIATCLPRSENRR